MGFNHAMDEEPDTKFSHFLKLLRGAPEFHDFPWIALQASQTTRTST